MIKHIGGSRNFLGEGGGGCNPRNPPLNPPMKQAKEELGIDGRRVRCRYSAFVRCRVKGQGHQKYVLL